MAGFLDDPVGYIFGPGTANPTYESLQRRRAIAAALASKRSKFPSNVGEGLTYFGEQLGDIIAERRTDAAEKAYLEGKGAVLDPSKAPSLTADEEPATGAATGGSAALPDEPVAAQVRDARAARGDGLAAVPTPAPITPQGPAGPAQMLASQPPAQTGPRPGRPVMPTSRNWGDDEAEAAGLYEPRAPTPPLATMAGAAPAPQQPLPVPGAPAGVPSAPDELRDRVAAAVRLQDAGQMGGGATPTPVAPQGNITYPPTAAAAQPGVMSDVPPVGISSPVGAAPPMGAPAAQGLAGAPDARAGIYSAVAAQNAPSSPVAPPGPRLAQAGGPAPVPAPVPAPAPAQVLPTPAQALPDIPGPMAPRPVPPPVERVPRTGVVSQPEFERPLNLAPPKPTPLTPQELYGQQLLRDRRTFGDPEVQQRAKEYIDFGAARRKFLDERNIEAWKHNQTLQKERETARIQAPKLEAEVRQKELENRDKEDAARLKAFYGDTPPAEIIADLRKGKEITQGIPQSNVAISQALKLLDDKALFTGSPANIEVAKQRLLQVLGYQVDPKLSGTEQLRLVLSDVAAQKRRQMSGNANVSNRDVEDGKQAAAADPSLQPATIRYILEGLQRTNLAQAVDQNDKVRAYTGSDPARMQTAFPLWGFTHRQMMELLPPAAIQRLHNALSSGKHDPKQVLEDFDEDFATPGLARRVLQMRR
jgi:hypothetical protein